MSSGNDTNHLSWGSAASLHPGAQPNKIHGNDPCRVGDHRAFIRAKSAFIECGDRWISFTGDGDGKDWILMRRAMTRRQLVLGAGAAALAGPVRLDRAGAASTS